MRFWYLRIHVYILILLTESIFSQHKPILLWEIYTYYVPPSSSYEQQQEIGFAELALSISPYNLQVQRNKDSSFFVAIAGNVEIISNNKLIKKDSFVVKSPSAKTLDALPDFGYIKRYWLKNHASYLFKLTIKDAFGKDTAATYRASKTVFLHYRPDSILFSSVQFIDVIEKSNIQDIYYKHGYTIVPYNDNYFNESFDQLKFLLEIYNTDTVLGKSEPFLIQYKILDKDTQTPLEKFGGFRKFTTSKANVLIGNIPLKNLPSGNYYLLIELKDKNNRTLKKTQVFFQRKGTYANNPSLLNEEMFFGKTNNLDTLKMWTEALWPIANHLEKEWIINQSLHKDAHMMKNFMMDFWNKRAADTANPIKLAREYYSKLNYVMKNFKCGKMAPYYTDRGRVYLQYGPPNQRSIQLSEPGAYPYEIWQYYRLYDGSTHQFFTNRKFVFVNKGIADDCYSLIHSDMKGEFNNPNWQREIMKHDPYHINDPYQQQKINYGNNFDKLYQNPQ